MDSKMPLVLTDISGHICMYIVTRILTEIIQDMQWNPTTEKEQNQYATIYATKWWSIIYARNHIHMYMAPINKFNLTKITFNRYPRMLLLAICKLTCIQIIKITKINKNKIQYVVNYITFHKLCFTVQVKFYYHNLRIVMLLLSKKRCSRIIKKAK